MILTLRALVSDFNPVQSAHVGNFSPTTPEIITAEITYCFSTNLHILPCPLSFFLCEEVLVLLLYYFDTEGNLKM